MGVGQFDAALADVKGLASDHALAGAVDLALADALLGKNDFAGAARHFRTYLGREKRGAAWAPVALRFANALLNHPKEAHAEEAVHLARRVMWEATGRPGRRRGQGVEKQALETLPSKRRKAFEHLSAGGDDPQGPRARRLRPAAGGGARHRQADQARQAEEGRASSPARRGSSAARRSSR